MLVLLLALVRWKTSHWVEWGNYRGTRSFPPQCVPPAATILKFFHSFWWDEEIKCFASAWTGSFSFPLISLLLRNAVWHCDAGVRKRNVPGRGCESCFKKLFSQCFEELFVPKAHSFQDPSPPPSFISMDALYLENMDFYPCYIFNPCYIALALPLARTSYLYRVVMPQFFTEICVKLFLVMEEAENKASFDQSLLSLTQQAFVTQPISFPDMK